MDVDGAIIRTDQASPNQGVNKGPSPDQPLLIDLGETGEQYLHLVLPADKINFLNGLEGQTVLGMEEDVRCSGPATGGLNNEYD